jgi:hypothetical protein
VPFGRDKGAVFCGQRWWYCYWRSQWQRVWQFLPPWTGAAVQDAAYTAVTPCAWFDSRTDTGDKTGAQQRQRRRHPTLGDRTCRHSKQLQELCWEGYETG